MLTAVETFYQKALQSQFHQLQVGPSHGPRAPGERMPWLVLSAEHLVLTPPEGASLPLPREPAWVTHTYALPADGQGRDFALPEEARGEVVEVESPPGILVRRGDAYMLEGRLLRFFQAPAREERAVVVHMRGERARGYTERCPCELFLVASAWVETREEGDSLLNQLLAGVLSASTRLGILDEVASKEFGVRLRLLHPEVSLQGVSRSADRVGEQDCFRARARFLLRGELEQAVVLGEAEPKGLIQRVPVRGTLLHE